MEYLLCGPERWMVERGPIYTEQLFGAAMKNTDRTLFLILRFLKATPFVAFVFYFEVFFFMVGPVLCCVLVPGTLAFHLLYTLMNCDCLQLFGLLYLTVCHHIIMTKYSISQLECILIFIIIMSYISRMKNQHEHRV